MLWNYPHFEPKQPSLRHAEPRVAQPASLCHEDAAGLHHPSHGLIVIAEFANSPSPPTQTNVHVSLVYGQHVRNQEMTHSAMISEGDGTKAEVKDDKDWPSPHARLG